MPPYGLTYLECFEHFARFMYAVQVLFMPELWLLQNTVVAPTPTAIWLCKLCGILLLCLKGHLVAVQMKSPKNKPYSWLVASLAWGACAALSYTNEPIFKKPEFYMNVGLQSFFAVAFGATYLLSGGKVKGR